MAIFTENMERAKKFYSTVFNWGFTDYGPSDFTQIKVNDGSQEKLIGAFQDRKYQLTDEKVIGFECSITVADIDDTLQLVESSGGVILMPKTEIPHVGWLIKFKDTEGNIVCAIQYFLKNR